MMSCVDGVDARPEGRDCCGVSWKPASIDAKNEMGILTTPKVQGEAIFRSPQNRKLIPASPATLLKKNTKTFK